MDKESRNS
jgi:hypothetical protein